MTFLVRSIRKTNWDFNYDETSDYFPADPIGDFQTSKNELSVYATKADQSDLDDIVIGLASTKRNTKPLRMVLIQDAKVTGMGYKLDSTTPGKTPYDKAKLLHRNIVELSAKDLLEIAKVIKLLEVDGGHIKFVQRTEKQVQQLLIRAIKDKDLDIDKLDSDLKTE